MDERPGRLRLVRLNEPAASSSGSSDPSPDVSNETAEEVSPVSPLPAEDASPAPEGAGEASSGEPAFDVALQATLGDIPVRFPTMEDSAAIENSLLFHYGTLLSNPEALVHAKSACETAGNTSTSLELADKLQALVYGIEALQARSADELDGMIESVLTYRATMEALNDYVGATGVDAALSILERQRGLLVTDLSMEIIENKVTELRSSGEDSGARMLARGPLRLVKDVRDHGLERGYQMFLERDRRMEEAKTRLAFLVGTSGSDVVEAVDAVLGAESQPELERALDRGYPWLIRLEAATMIREALVISEAGGGDEEEVARFTHLAGVVERLMAIAQAEPGLSRQEHVTWALSTHTND
jgi:hypothetical protein